MGDSLIAKLPQVRGSYRERVNLAKVNWFNVGGDAEVLFKPQDEQDLASFLKNCSKNIPLTIIGVGSNLLVRDGGIRGVVIRLGRELAKIEKSENYIICGAGALDVNVAKFAQENSLAGLEFLVGIPGTIGGAIAMNGGAYGSDLSQVLEQATAVDENGEIINLKNSDFGFYYRGHSIKKRLFFTSARLRAVVGNSQNILEKMNEISAKREEAQPIRSRTSGSTFKNPKGHKAWELIDKSGCRGLKIGGAQVSEKHCNFFINTGEATAVDIENLGQEVIKRVKEKTGITLEWEIKIIGEK